MTKSRSQTIRIFLPTGNPRGIRKVSRSSNSNITLFVVPRLHLNSFCNMEESGKMGIYLLADNHKLYVGQTTELRNRLKQHDKGKTFWEKAFAVVLNNEFCTRDHLDCLERMTIEQAQLAQRLELENGTEGNRQNHLHDSIRSDCENIFDEIDTLLAVLNQDFFEKVSEQKNHVSLEITHSVERMVPEENQIEGSSESNEEIFYCRNVKRGIEARGKYQKDGFLLLRSSTLRLDHTPFMEQKTRLPAWKKKMIEEGMLKEQDGLLVLMDDCFIKGRPSASSDWILGKPSNGWIEWKNAEGKTLDELYRKNK